MRTKLIAVVAALLCFIPLSASALAVATVPQGGTGSSTLTGILLGNGTAAVRSIKLGTNLSLVGTTLNASGGGSSFAYPFPNNATSTALTFSGGLSTTYASTTGVSGTFVCISTDCRTTWPTNAVSSVFARSGAVTAQSGDYTTAQVTESGSLYYTTTRFDNRLSATTSLPNITTLANLSLPYSQLTGTPTFFGYPFPSNATSTSIAFNGGLSGALTGNASTATALAANGTNCSAGNYPLGVDASGNSEGCTAATTASSTLLTDANKFSGVNLFTNASSDFSGTWQTFSPSHFQTALGFTAVPNTRAINTTYPVQGGGDLSADRSISLAFGTTTSNTWAGTQAFTNLITGSISGNAGTATALAANGTNCSAGNYPLGVDASGNAESCTAAGGTLTGTQGQVAYFSGSNTAVGTSSLFIDATGNVGIGTTSPQKLFHVEGNQSGGIARIQRDFAASTNQAVGTYDIQLNETSGLQDLTGPAQTFSISNNGNTPNIAADIVAVRSGADTTGALDLRPYKAGTPLNLLTLDGATGNAGISTTTPGAALAVAGNSLLAGVVTGQYFLSTSTANASRFAYASTTMVTATTASTTNLIVSGVRSALALAGADGTVSAYAGSSGTCTNQVPTSLSATGVLGGCTSISDAMLASTFVKSLTVTTGQGVSGSFSAGATPALSLTLGALTGLTSINGLVVTANTGVITTGTWNGTTIALANGGTNATSFNTSGNSVYYDGTRLATALTTASVTTPFASSTAITASGTIYSNIFIGTATSTLGAVGIASSTPWNNLSIGSGGAVVVGENKISTSTTQTIDWNRGNQQLIQGGTSAVTISFSNYLAGQTLRLVYCNPGTTAGAITWPGTNILQWAGATAPTQTTTASQCDVYSFIATQASSTSASNVLVFGAASTGFK